MNSFKIKAVIYTIIFIAASVFSYMISIGKNVYTPATHTMSDAGLPLIYMTSESGIKYNLLHGHTVDVEERQIHDSITPIDVERKLDINIKTYGCAVSGVSYELWTVNMETLIERAEGLDYSGKDGVISTTLRFKNLINDGVEYLLKIKLNTESYEEVAYYTRLVKLKDASVENRLSYVNTFSENTRRDETLGRVTAKLEPNSSGDNTNLGRVNIHSKLSQVGFANLLPEMMTERYFTITEIDDTRTSVLVNYRVSTSDSTGDYQYNIKEFYRIYQPGSNVTYVYNFERWMNQIFAPSKGINSKGEIYLGIRSDTNVNMKSSSNGNITAFESDGTLWAFSAVKNSLSKVFSFEEKDSDGLRELYDEFGIKILNVYNNGSVDFLVYGYMNKGPHEGENGIAVYKYESAGRTSKEIMFIPRTDSTDVIGRDVNEMSYLSSENKFYMYSNGAVYYIDCNTKEYMITDMDIISENSMANDSQGIYVYQTGSNTETCKELKILHLSTGDIVSVKADKDEYIKMLGYIDGNIVYGKGFMDMKYTDAEGREMLPLYTIIIMDKDSNVVRRYGEDKIYVVGAEFSEEQIIFNRVQLGENGLMTPTQSDSLLSSVTSNRKRLEVITETTDLRQKEQYISMVVNGSGKAAVHDCRYEYSDKTTVMISDIYRQEIDLYYAYSFGELGGLCEQLSQAVSIANDGAGVVVNASGVRIWDRYKPTSHKLTISDKISSLTFENATKYIRDNIGTDLDLSGNKVDAVLYFVGKGKYVISKTGTSSFEVIYRYDSKNVYSYDIVSHKEKTYTKDKFDQLIKGYGSILLIYDEG